MQTINWKELNQITGLHITHRAAIPHQSTLVHSGLLVHEIGIYGWIRYGRCEIDSTLSELVKRGPVTG